MLNTLSARGKIWQSPPDFTPSADFLAVVENSPWLAKILLKRGIDTAAKAESFIFADKYTPTSPYALPDVDKAVARINQAIANNEQITIYGDYDVDGVTSTSLMVMALKKLSAKVGYYIPNRASEGYGLNLKAVSILASKQRTKLLITCDCGVANFAEINFAKSLGLDTIVLDHHALPELLPPAKAIVHPKLLTDEHPLFHLPGVGVAYKVAEALLAHHGLQAETETFLDYVTLGMIADLVPLIVENRYLVQLGLPKLIASPRPGIKALLNQVQPSSDTDIVGFGLAPRINAVGRLADAQVAVELLTTDNPTIARQLSAQLENENTKRQEICEQVLSEAEQMLAGIKDLKQQKAIAIYKDGWHHGVVGIVASRLVDKYHMPVFIAELDPREQTVKGSARGVAGLDLCEALKANAHLLNKWGGHKMAAGFSLAADKADAFCAGIVATCNRLMSNMSAAPTLEIDVTMPNMDIDLFACAQSLAKLAPFGMENKKPLFLSSNLLCELVSPLGRNGKHHRLDVRDTETNKKFSCVYWNTRNIIPTNGDTINIVFTPEINVFNGKERLQLVLSDWQLSNKNVVASPVINHTAAPSSTSITSTLVAFSPPPPTSVAPIASTPEALPTSLTPTTSLTSSPATPQTLTPKLTLVDLRQFENSKITSTAIAKLGNNLSIFCEGTETQAVGTFDRLSLPKRPHLLIKQWPPSLTIWKQIITTSGANKVYLLGTAEAQPLTAAAFIKRLLGLIRYVVNKKSGTVESSRIATVLATTDVASALALALLRKIDLIDWYADAGIVYLDLLENPVEQEIKQLTEYHQLEDLLQQINNFRQLCTKASLNEIESMINNGHNDSDQTFQVIKQELNPNINLINTPEEYAFYQR